VRNKLAAFAICTVTTLLISPALSMSASAQVSPAQTYDKLFTGQEKEVVSAAEAMPADKYNFKPTKGTFEGVRTFAQQVTHIAASQYYYFGDFGVKGGVDNDALNKLTNKDDIVDPRRLSHGGAGPYQRPLRTDGYLSAHERDYPPGQPQTVIGI
jgi:hypothetical protein